MTALTESQQSRRSLRELLAVELAPREGRWAAVRAHCDGLRHHGSDSDDISDTAARVHGLHRLSNQQG